MSGDEGSSALAAIARSVEANPVFAMSLGSKELFHSNLLAWFIGHHRPVAEALGMRGEVTVLREKDHTDLLIRHGRRQVTVIENKVFALPDTSQLARLAGSPEAAAAELVLLSLTSPGWPDGTWASPGGRSWTWLSYRQLGDRQRPALPAVTAADAYAGATLERWLDHVAQLEDLAQTAGRPVTGRAGDAAGREEEAARQAGFFDFSFLPAAIAAAPADGFRHYAPDFVYRYAHVPGITIGQAVQAGSEYARRIAKAAN